MRPKSTILFMSIYGPLKQHLGDHRNPKAQQKKAPEVIGFVTGALESAQWSAGLDYVVSGPFMLLCLGVQWLFWVS